MLGFNPSQRNRLFAMIESLGLQPRNFVETTRSWEWAGWVDSEAYAIEHRDSGYWFTIGEPHARSHVSYTRTVPQTGPQLYAVYYSPGEISETQRQTDIDFNDVIRHYNRWLTSLKRELSQPDLWAELERAIASATESIAYQAADNAPLSLAEAGNIKAVLSDLSHQMTALSGASTLQHESIRREIKYLTDATERLGKKDFLNAMLGGLVGWLLSAALPPETIRSALPLILGTFKSLLTGLKLVQ
jgi:hypothetical protein